MSKNNVTISLKEAAELFTQLGFNAVNVSKWNAERFNEKLKKMSKIIDDPDEIDPSVITDKKVRKLFDTIAASMKAGGSVEVVEVESSETEEKPAKAEKKAPAALADDDDDAPAKPAKAAAKPAKEEKPAKQPAKPAAKPAKSSKPAAKSEPAAVDKFGSREGSGGAKINAVLTKKPQTTDEIVKASGVLKATVQEHLWKLRSVKKVIDRNDDGWFIKK